MSPQRIQRKRTAGWRMPEGAVYVGRPSRWGNPFCVYHGHTLIGPSWFDARAVWTRTSTAAATEAYTTSSDMSLALAVEQFRMLMNVRERDESDRLAAWLAPLVGRDLACWCPTDQPCHADVLLELANGDTAR